MTMNCRILQKVGILAEIGILINLDFSIEFVPEFTVCCVLSTATGLMSDVMSSTVYPRNMRI